ncbi:MAG: hypothetical protein SGCHY_002114, partial [Lobulomycetales sp.]
MSFSKVLGVMHVKTLQRPFGSAAAVQNSPIKVTQTAVQIAGRVVATQLLLTRWGVEAALFSLPMAKDKSKAELDEEKQRIIAGNETLNLAIDRAKGKNLFTDRELGLLEKTVGSWDPQQDIGRLQKRWESLAVLLWSLRIVKNLTPCTVNADEKTLFECTSIVPAFPDTIDSFIEYFSTGHGSEDTHIISDKQLAEQINIAE